MILNGGDRSLWGMKYISPCALTTAMKFGMDLLPTVWKDSLKYYGVKTLATCNFEKKPVEAKYGEIRCRFTEISVVCGDMIRDRQQ